MSSALKMFVRGSRWSRRAANNSYSFVRTGTKACIWCYESCLRAVPLPPRLLHALRLLHRTLSVPHRHRRQQVLYRRIPSGPYQHPNQTRSLRHHNHHIFTSTRTSILMSIITINCQAPSTRSLCPYQHNCSSTLRKPWHRTFRHRHKHRHKRGCKLQAHLHSSQVELLHHLVVLQRPHQASCHPWALVRKICQVERCGKTELGLAESVGLLPTTKLTYLPDHSIL